MAFVMPPGFSRTDLPHPDDSRVELVGATPYAHEREAIVPSGSLEAAELKLAVSPVVDDVNWAVGFRLTGPATSSWCGDFRS